MFQCSHYIFHYIFHYTWFSRDVINILKCKITEPLSFQLSLVIKHAKYIYF